MGGLAVSGLSFAYGKRVALDDLSFSVAPGGFCALLGPNGAGKSTLFALLVRLLVSRRGRITIAGVDLAQEPRKALARIGVVFQAPSIDLDLSVRRNLRYHAALHGLSGAKAAHRIDTALARLDADGLSARLVRHLSGGERRRVEIARALVHDPPVLLLDEPTAGLDAVSRQNITDHVHRLAGEGRTVLWATHLADEIGDGDHVLVLHRGRLRADGPVDRLRASRPLVERFLALTGEGP